MISHMAASFGSIRYADPEVSASTRPNPKGMDAISLLLSAGTPVTREFRSLARKGGFNFYDKREPCRFALSTTTVIEKVTSDIS